MADAAAQPFQLSAAKLISRQRDIAQSQWPDPDTSSESQTAQVLRALCVVTGCNPEGRPVDYLVSVAKDFILADGLLSRLADLEESRMSFDTLALLQGCLEGDAFSPARRNLDPHAVLVADVIAALYEAQCAAVCPSSCGSPPPAAGRTAAEGLMSPPRRGVDRTTPRSSTSGRDASDWMQQVRRLHELRVRQGDDLAMLQGLREKGDEQRRQLQELRKPASDSSRFASPWRGTETTSPSARRQSAPAKPPTDRPSVPADDARARAASSAQRLRRIPSIAWLQAGSRTNCPPSFHSYAAAVLALTDGGSDKPVQGMWQRMRAVLNKPRVLPQQANTIDPWDTPKAAAPLLAALRDPADRMASLTQASPVVAAVAEWVWWYSVRWQALGSPVAGTAQATAARRQTARESPWKQRTSAATARSSPRSKAARAASTGRTPRGRTAAPREPRTRAGSAPARRQTASRGRREVLSPPARRVDPPSDADVAAPAAAALHSPQRRPAAVAAPRMSPTVEAAEAALVPALVDARTLTPRDLVLMSEHSSASTPTGRLIRAVVEGLSALTGIGAALANQPPPPGHAEWWAKGSEALRAAPCDVLARLRELETAAVPEAALERARSAIDQMPAVSTQYLAANVLSDWVRAVVRFNTFCRETGHDIPQDLGARADAVLVGAALPQVPLRVSPGPLRSPSVSPPAPKPDVRPTASPAVVTAPKPETQFALAPPGAAQAPAPGPSVAPRLAPSPLMQSSGPPEASHTLGLLPVPAAPPGPVLPRPDEAAAPGQLPAPAVLSPGLPVVPPPPPPPRPAPVPPGPPDADAPALRGSGGSAGTLAHGSAPQPPPAVPPPPPPAPAHHQPLPAPPAPPQDTPPRQWAPAGPVFSPPSVPAPQLPLGQDSVARMVLWLHSHGLGKYESAFIENEVDMDSLLFLTEADLTEMNVAIGPKRKLLALTAARRLQSIDERRVESGDDPLRRQL
eukprot:TRINITY_DN1460_c0_g2_i1.p1 TRINITY_DN1460_c0_g2~~TRINITY_DN1460_c0_g2_i1.p1  ORF type:complete len:988 (+),score=286.77 TRINITY_DN1460_c0_g2_i1:52-2964(+)